LGRHPFRSYPPSLSKHLTVLERAVLICVGRDAQVPAVPIRSGSPRRRRRMIDQQPLRLGGLFYRDAPTPFRSAFLRSESRCQSPTKWRPHHERHHACETNLHRRPTSRNSSLHLRSSFPLDLVFPFRGRHLIPEHWESHVVVSERVTHQNKGSTKAPTYAPVGEWRYGAGGT